MLTTSVLPGKGKFGLILAVFILTFLITPAGVGQAAPTEQIPIDWYNSGLTLPESIPRFCLDGINPHRLYYADGNSANKGTYSFDWYTRETHKLSSQEFTGCDENGGYFYRYEDANKYQRFSPTNPQAISIDHFPTYSAKDGSGLAISREVNGNYASEDGGKSWRQIGTQYNFSSVVMSSSDPRSLYGMVYSSFKDSQSSLDYTIYYSPDFGRSWQNQAQGSIPGLLEMFLDPLQGNGGPIDTFQLVGRSSGANTSVLQGYLTVDGGKTFQLAGGGPFTLPNLYYTPNGIVRFSRTESIENFLSVSQDGGKSWQTLSVPFNFLESPENSFRQVENAPSNFFFLDKKGNTVWYSADSARSWKKVGHYVSDIRFSPYLPLTVIGIENGQVYLLDLPNAGKPVTTPAIDNRVPGGFFFPETRHNLNGIFQKYWVNNGGLAQFGFPKSEPFREINRADGKAYTVQYLERNRFEYHPEFAGTPYEVSLGLLGVQLTQNRKDAGDLHFAPVTDAGYPGGVYFPLTGHNLKGKLKSYWEANGGLSIYGYPITDEFEELNQADGKTYIVQYFERARFELHPENAGTSYEVLLGLLGNEVLVIRDFIEN